MTEQPRRRRHLMDPDNPVRQVNDHRLTNVQRWVISVLTVFTIGHLVVGMILAALATPQDATVPRIGLCVIAGAFGAIAVAAGHLIHGRNPLNAWLLVGLVPTAIGLWLAL